MGPWSRHIPRADAVETRLQGPGSRTRSLTITAGENWGHVRNSVFGRPLTLDQSSTASRFEHQRVAVKLAPRRTGMESATDHPAHRALNEMKAAIRQSNSGRGFRLPKLEHPNAPAPRLSVHERRTLASEKPLMNTAFSLESPDSASHRPRIDRNGGPTWIETLALVRRNPRPPAPSSPRRRRQTDPTHAPGAASSIAQSPSDEYRSARPAAPHTPRP